jgi:hypothetical protein
MDINYNTPDIFNPEKNQASLPFLKKPECRVLVLPNGNADDNSSDSHFYRCNLAESIKIFDFLDEYIRTF